MRNICVFSLVKVMSIYSCCFFNTIIIIVKLSPTIAIKVCRGHTTSLCAKVLQIQPMVTFASTNKTKLLGVMQSSSGIKKMSQATPVYVF